MEIFENYSPNKFELLHIGNFDVVLNNQQSSLLPEEMSSLRETIVFQLKKAIPSRLLPDWKYRRGNFVDNEKMPKYFLKTKQMTRNTQIYDDVRNGQMDILYLKKSRQAAMSITSELSISVDIRKVVESEQVQRMFQEIGFKTIDFVEPLIGIIDRQTGNKSLIYKFLKAHTLDRCVREGKFLNDVEISKTIYKFEKILNISGIVPCDISDEQFLVSVDKNGSAKLHLIDTEFYFKDKIVQDKEYATI